MKGKGNFFHSPKQIARGPINVGALWNRIRAGFAVCRIPVSPWVSGLKKNDTLQEHSKIQLANSLSIEEKYIPYPPSSTFQHHPSRIRSSSSPWRYSRCCILQSWMISLTHFATFSRFSDRGEKKHYDEKMQNLTSIHKLGLVHIVNGDHLSSAFKYVRIKLCT